MLRSKLVSALQHIPSKIDKFRWDDAGAAIMCHVAPQKCLFIIAFPQLQGEEAENVRRCEDFFLGELQ